MPTDIFPNSNGYRITQEFHNDDHHTGVDLVNTPKGTPPTPGGEVRSIFEGTVVLALPEQNSSNFGNVIMIGHIFPDGVFYSLYAHLENPSNRNICSSVITGEPIGTVGSTGKTDPPDTPHLHLAIKTKGILGCGYINDNCNSERISGFSNYASEGPLQFIENHRETSPVSPLPPSTTFAIGDRVRTITNLNTRCFPNPNLADTILGVQPLDSHGTVIGGPVYTDGFWWWKIDYDGGPDGWNAEGFLELVSPPGVDVNPPVLENFSFTPASIDTSAGTANISFTLHVTDDLSGVDYGYIYFRKPSGSTISTNRFSAPISGTINDGIYQVVMTFPQGSEIGTWEISSIWIPDKTGNSMNIETNELQLMGFPTLFISH